MEDWWASRSGAGASYFVLVLVLVLENHDSPFTPIDILPDMPRRFGGKCWVRRSCIEDEDEDEQEDDDRRR